MIDRYLMPGWLMLQVSKMAEASSSLGDEAHAMLNEALLREADTYYRKIAAYSNQEVAVKRDLVAAHGGDPAVFAELEVHDPSGKVPLKEWHRHGWILTLK